MSVPPTTNWTINNRQVPTGTNGFRIRDGHIIPESLIPFNDKPTTHHITKQGSFKGMAYVCLTNESIHIGT